MEVDHFDLGDVLKLLGRLSNEYSTVDSCRPDYLKKNLKVSAYDKILEILTFRNPICFFFSLERLETVWVT